MYAHKICRSFTEWIAWVTAKPGERIIYSRCTRRMGPSANHFVGPKAAM